MRKKLLYIIISLSIFVLILIAINLVDIINVKKEREYQKLKSALKVLYIELNNSDLSIIRGEKLNIDYNKKDIDITINDKKVYISEKNNQSSNIEIAIPNDFTFNQLSIKTNKGNINLSSIVCEFFSVSSESGNVSIDNFNITNKTDLAINSSNMNIKDSIMHNVDVFIEDGSLTYDGILDGKNEINTSSGTLNFNLDDKLDNYQIMILDNNKNIKVNNKTINNESYTKGNKIIKINGKGKIEINGDVTYE